MDQLAATVAAPAVTTQSPWLVEVEDLHVHLVTTRGVVRAVARNPGARYRGDLPGTDEFAQRVPYPVPHGERRV